MLKKHLYKSDLRAVSALAVDATLSVTSIVERMHHNVIRAPYFFGPLAHPRGKALTGAVYGLVRGVTRSVGWGLDKTLAHLSEERAGLEASREREAFLSALNGVIGDKLAKTQNSLAIPMTFRDEKEQAFSARALPTNDPEVSSKLLILIHGLCMTDSQWTWKGHNHGLKLAEDLGYTPIFVRYNTGLPIFENGRQFAAQLNDLVENWPVKIRDISLIGHSMGGLVARSAVHWAEKAKLECLSSLKNAVFLGSPHFGAPLERLGHHIEFLLGLSPYTVALRTLGQLRSAGITDLRYGHLREEDWRGRSRFGFAHEKAEVLRMPETVSTLAIAASLSKWGTVGDGLVPIKSALGQCGEADLFKKTQLIRNAHHLDLLNNQKVYEAIRALLRG